MRHLTQEGQQIINNLAQRFNFSNQAVESMLQSVIAGNGSMAQFNHPEFGGSGQWMRGGMIMIGDMFNNYLKNNVSGLCQELSGILAEQPGLLQTGSFQSQSQGGQQQTHFSNQPNQAAVPSNNAGQLFAPPPAGSSGNWWPAGLQYPTSTGGQNNSRYAYFATINRLAIEANGHVTLYDTLDHHIGGFSQQQSGNSSFSFTSQYGWVDINTLPIISIDNQAVARDAVPPFTNPQPNAVANEQVLTQEADVFSAIEKLAALKAKGILNDAEFSAKKAELLARL